MGIEPTSRMVNIRLNGFEDRGHHQVCKHFRSPRVNNLTRGDDPNVNTGRIPSS